jgi:hypothetical protein
MPYDTPADSDGEFHAVITRADGSVEDLGVIAATYKNPFKRAWWRMWGRPRADQRIARANRSAARLAAQQKE